MINRIANNRDLKYGLMCLGHKMKIISDKKWTAYCDNILDILLSNNKDVLERLKRGEEKNDK